LSLDVSRHGYVDLVTTTPNGRRGVRLREANREQLSWGRIDLDAQLSEDHAARAIWAVVGRLDLTAFYGSIEARAGVAGAPAIDPKVLLALWAYATSDGEGSAREVWRLTQEHMAYRWLCGGVDVGYHTLSYSASSPWAADLLWK
jgi:transposase